MAYEDWESVMGLEVHAQLKTDSKIFSNDSTSFGSGDNENTNPVSLGLPGALPVLNKKAVEFSIRTGLALGCKINNESVFARKNYFYPDLPKGYQISQFDKPLCGEGVMDIFVDGKKVSIGIERAHMEEDAGKSLHHGDFSLINLNRAGVPLLEIVSAPDMRQPAEAAEYARTVRQILRYVDTCDGNLEEGSLRCDCNVSVRKKGDTKLGTKVEIKNINSFRFVEKAIEYEIRRQIEVIESGGEIIQETRLYDPAKDQTTAMRTKEEAHDYRYFPDPDLLPLQVSDEWIEEIRLTLPELPSKRVERFQSEYGIPKYDAEVLTQEIEMADFYEAVVKACGNGKAASNWVMGETMRFLKEESKVISNCPITPENLGKLVKLVGAKTISSSMAKTVFQEMWKEGADPEAVVKEKGLAQITDTGAIEKIIDEIIANNTNQVEQYRGGKDKLFGFFVGQAMKATKGQADPEMVNKLLKDKLKG